MEYYIALATWLYVRILTQYFTTKSKAAADQELTFLFTETMACPGGTSQLSLFPILLNLPCLLLQKKNWGHFSLHPKNGSNEKHTGGNEMAPAKITHSD